IRITAIQRKSRAEDAAFSAMTLREDCLNKTFIASAPSASSVAGADDADEPNLKSGRGLKHSKQTISQCRESFALNLNEQFANRIASIKKYNRWSCRPHNKWSRISVFGWSSLAERTFSVRASWAGCGVT